MQLAINILIFVVGFSLATFASLRTKSKDHYLRRLFDDLRSTLSSLTPSSSRGETFDAGDGNEAVITNFESSKLDSQDLLTRSVNHRRAFR